MSTTQYDFQNTSFARDCRFPTTHLFNLESTSFLPEILDSSASLMQERRMEMSIVNADGGIASVEIADGFGVCEFQGAASMRFSHRLSSLRDSEMLTAETFHTLLSEAAASQVTVRYGNATSPLSATRLFAQRQLLQLKDQDAFPGLEIVLWDPKKKQLASSAQQSLLSSFKEGQLLHIDLPSDALKGSAASRLKGVLSYALTGEQTQSPAPVSSHVFEALSRQLLDFNALDYAAGSANVLFEVPYLSQPGSAQAELKLGSLQILACKSAMLVVHDGSCTLAAERLKSLKASQGKRDLDNGTCLFFGMVDASLHQAKAVLEQAVQQVREQAHQSLSPKQITSDDLYPMEMRSREYHRLLGCAREYQNAINEVIAYFHEEDHLLFRTSREEESGERTRYLQCYEDGTKVVSKSIEDLRMLLSEFDRSITTARSLIETQRNDRDEAGKARTKEFRETLTTMIAVAAFLQSGVSEAHRIWVGLGTALAGALILAGTTYRQRIQAFAAKASESTTAKSRIEVQE
jgi:hypothetical protein